MLISQSTIERIKEIPVLDVIRHYVDLKKAGQQSWRGLSPWTDEKTPSFYVVPSKNIFKDFSTGRGGDAIKFVMEKLNLSYPEAIKEIAQKCNERVEYDKKPTKEREEEIAHEEKLYKVNQAAARKYAEQLSIVNCQLSINESGEASADHIEHPAVQELIGKRKFTPETIMQWELGFAPPLPTTNNQQPTTTYTPEAWRFLTDLVGDKSRAEALELGLIKYDQKNDRTYDFFRNRIIFPIHNTHGRIVSFGGRWLGVADQYNAKYLNGPETRIYKKETVLFGLHFAHKAIREAGYAYLMEGYTDVISFHQASFNVAVGTCGTALTETQCKLLFRYCKKVVLFYDGDTAGQDATLRAIDMLYAQGFEVAVVPMPVTPEGGKVDPDELVRIFNNPAAPVPAQPEAKPNKPVKKSTKKKKA